MRYFLTALAIVALIASPGPAKATVVLAVDGLVGDWQTLGLYLNAPIGTPEGAMHITHYGAAVFNGTLYAFMELDRPVDNFDRWYPGVFINADENTGTELTTGTGMDPLDVSIAGTDLLVEWDFEAGGSSNGLYYYGYGDSIDTQGATIIPDGVTASAGNVLEWSVPVSGIKDTLATLPDGVDSSLPWSVYLRVEGHLYPAYQVGGDGGWGYNVAGPTTVPEPGMFILLAGALAAALAHLAWRRR